MHDIGVSDILGPAGAVWVIIDWAIRIVSLYVIPRNRRPTAGMAWLLLIFIIPIPGFITYAIFGNYKLPKPRRHSQATLNAIIDKTFERIRKSDQQAGILEVAVPPDRLHLAQLSKALTNLPVLGGNRVEVMAGYDEILTNLVKDIDRATRMVHLEYFIFVLDQSTEPVFAALGRAVKRGVVVRVLQDWSSVYRPRYPRWRLTKERLEADGVIVELMLPWRLPGFGYVRPDLRNHRKLAVIDGHTGYTGSLNLIQRDYHRRDSVVYDELVVRLQGPIVLELSAVFLTDWYSETNLLLDHEELGLTLTDIVSHGRSMAQILPSGPGYDDENNLKLFVSLIHSARKRITIVNPYFVPDDALTVAITAAAKRGVEVTIINSEAMDQWLVGHAQRSFYEVFLGAGVALYLYKAPALLHAKFITVDDDIATIGSSNLDIRSFYLNLEITLISYDSVVVKELRAVEAHYLKNSRHITPAQWRRHPRRQIFMDNIARLTSSLE